MSTPSIPPGSPQAVRLLIRVSLWLIRRPFLLPRGLTCALAVAAVLASVLLIGHGVVVAGVLGLAVALVFIASSVHWALLARGRRPVVLLSVFNAPSSAGRSTAESHIATLRRFLESDEPVIEAGPMTIRMIGVPISDAAAKRLLRLRSVALVVRGTGDAGTYSSQWNAHVWFNDSHADVDLTTRPLSTYRDSPSRLMRMIPFRSSAQSTRVIEGDLAPRAFFATTVTVRHFRDIAKLLLVILGEAFLAGPGPKEPRTLLIPASDDDAIGANMQGRVLILEATARLSAEPPDAILRDIEDRALAQGLGDTSLARWITAQWFCGEMEDWSTPEQTAASFVRWCERYPDDSTLAANQAGTAIRLGNDRLAEGEIERADRLGAPRSLVHRLRGNLAWMQRDPRTALSHYRRAAGVFRRGDLRWQRGECHEALGHRRRAMRHYRVALRRDPFRVPAAECARRASSWGRLLPTWPPGWRFQLYKTIHTHPSLSRLLLFAWQRVRPEDPYLATWLGRQALIKGNVKRAADWIAYATAFADTNRVIANVDDIVLLCLMGAEQAEDMAAFLGRHMDWLEEQGVPYVRLAASIALRQLLDASPYLREQPQTRQAIDLLTAEGVDLAAPLDETSRATPSTS